MEYQPNVAVMERGDLALNGVSLGAFYIPTISLAESAMIKVIADLLKRIGAHKTWKSPLLCKPYMQIPVVTEQYVIDFQHPFF